MKLGRTLLLLPAVALLAAMPAGNSSADQLRSQIQGSCLNGRSIEKTILAVSDPLAAKMFQPTCGEQQGDSAHINLVAELATATEYLFDSPQLAEYFTTTRQGECTYAQRKLGSERKSSLVSQTVQRDTGTGKILYWESHILRDNIFVDTEEHIWVFFHPDGSFRESYLLIRTSGSLTSKGIHSEIHLQALQP